jgi:ubiquinone/menaquinone biosynthesis C-methylase UbiE
MLKTIYDVIDPGDYEERHKRSPREAYSYHHWRPVICEIIQLLCKSMQKHGIMVEALDVGCGTGVYTEEISRFSKMCIGLDLSENMIEYAKKRREGLNLVLADAHNLPFRDDCFNLVVSVGLLEYVRRDVVLKEIARTLKEGTF